MRNINRNYYNIASVLLISISFSILFYFSVNIKKNIMVTVVKPVEISKPPYFSEEIYTSGDHGFEIKEIKMLNTIVMTNSVRSFLKRKINIII